ncbi:MAG: hypothetical protein ACOZCO_05530 [Bacteroidota bacterium]
MSTVALTLMICTYVVVTGFTLYYFIKVLKTPSKPEEDSFSENDNEQR